MCPLIKSFFYKIINIFLKKMCFLSKRFITILPFYIMCFLIKRFLTWSFIQPHQCMLTNMYISQSEFCRESSQINAHFSFKKLLCPTKYWCCRIQYIYVLWLSWPCQNMTFLGCSHFQFLSTFIFCNEA